MLSKFIVDAQLTTLPLTKKLPITLLLGCGGGYDLFTGLPLYFDIVQSHKDWTQPLLVSFSFTSTDLLQPYKVADIGNLYKVTPSSSSQETNGENSDTDVYFPELKLASLLGTDIYAIPTDICIGPYRSALSHLITNNHINTVVAVDGGCDSMLFGTERELGTPVEDMMTLCVLDHLNKIHHFDGLYLTCLGANIELVNHEDFLHNTKKLAEQKGLIDSIDLQSIRDLQSIHDCKSSQTNPVCQYIDIIKQCNTNQSVINSSIVAALEGNTGRYINPLLSGRISLPESFPLLNEPPAATTTFWVFDLAVVAQQVIYLRYLHNIDDNGLIDVFVTMINDALWPEDAKYNLVEIYGAEQVAKVQHQVSEVIAISEVGSRKLGPGTERR